MAHRLRVGPYAIGSMMDVQLVHDNSCCHNICAADGSRATNTGHNVVNSVESCFTKHQCGMLRSAAHGSSPIIILSQKRKPQKHPVLSPHRQTQGSSAVSTFMMHASCYYSVQGCKHVMRWTNIYPCVQLPQISLSKLPVALSAAAAAMIAAAIYATASSLRACCSNACGRQRKHRTG